MSNSSQPSNRSAAGEPQGKGPSSPRSDSNTLGKLAALLSTAKTMVLEKSQESLLRFVVEQAAEAVEADRCSLFLTDPTDGCLVTRVALGESGPIVVDAGQGLVGDVVRNGRVVLIRDARSDPRFAHGVDSVTGYVTMSVLAVPIRNSDGKTIGALEALNRQSGDFTLLDAELLEALAALVGAVLDTARQREQLVTAVQSLHRKEHQFQLLYSFEQAFVRGENLEDCISPALEVVRQALRAEGVSVLLGTSKESGLRFWHVAAEVADTLSGVALEPGEGIAWQVFEDGEARIVNAAHEDPAFSRRAEQLSGVITRNLLAVPLVFQEQREGVMEVINSQSGAFTDEDLQMAQILGAVLAQSLCRLRMLQRERLAERLANVGRMTGSIVHDLKNPLTVIQGYAELLAGESDPTELARISKVLENQTIRCRRLTQDLLDFCAGRQQLMLDHLEVRDYFEALRGALKDDLSRAKITLEMDVRIDGTFEVDRYKLDRVFLNLASNSRSAMPTGGSFSVEGWEELEALHFRVADTGPGIPEVVAARLFEPFVTHGKREGTGLGLSIIKDIVEAHGGSIQLVGSAGAQFLIRLPRTTSRTPGPSVVAS